MFNPIAGRRRAQLLWRVVDLLLANGIRLEIMKTNRAGDAEVMARAAVSGGADMVVAAGGDGTIADVANGLMGTAARLGIIPLGTANVLAHELDLSFAPHAIAAALAFGRTRPIWPGVAHGVAPGGAACPRLFMQMLGVGFDAQVVHRLPLRLKRVCGRGAYVMQTVRELARYEFGPIRVRLDGAETEAGSVIVTKGRLFGGRYLLAPEARCGEPGFSVVLFDRRGPAAALMYGMALPLDLLSRAPGLRNVRAARIEFIGNAAIPAQSDGDPAGDAPLAVTDAPHAIDVVMAT